MEKWEDRKKAWTPEQLSDYGRYQQHSHSIPKFQYDPVIAVLEDWFNAIESGTAGKRLPSPSGVKYTKEQCDSIIRTIDERFEYELVNSDTYWRGVGKQLRGTPIDYPPEFDRLTGASREAFVQAVKAKIAECVVPVDNETMSWVEGYLEGADEVAFW